MKVQFVMPPRPGLTERLVVDAAIELADEKGLANLTLVTLAERLQVKAPSLYNHVDGLSGLKRTMTLRALEELGTSMQRAAMGRAGLDALREVATAYRSFAKHHPGLYPLTQGGSEEADEVLKEAGWKVVEVVLAVLRAYQLEQDEALHAVRCIRSALHGFVSLELQGSFGLPLDLDESLECLISLLDRGFKDWHSQKE
jgi:AcrR family transcriptional regulator